MTDRDRKPENVTDPMVEVIERRRDMLRKLIPMPGAVRRPARRGDFEQRRRRR